MDFVVRYLGPLVGAKVPVKVPIIPEKPVPVIVLSILWSVPGDVLRVIVNYCIVDARTRCRLRAVCRKFHGMIVPSWIPIGSERLVQLDTATCRMCHLAPLTKAHGSVVQVNYNLFNPTKERQMPDINPTRTSTYTFVCSQKCLDQLCISACIAWGECDSRRVGLFQDETDVHMYRLDVYYTPKPRVNILPERVIKRLRVS